MHYIHRKSLCATVINYKGIAFPFLPGLNTVSDGEMKLLEESSAFKSEIECGNMSVGGKVESETTDVAESGATSLRERGAKLAEEIRSMNVENAKKFIAEIGDAYILRAILEKDPRKGVQEAVEARIKSIKAQEGSDLAPESKSAPGGTNDNFVENIEVTKEAMSGSKTTAAIPALNDDEKF